MSGRLAVIALGSNLGESSATLAAAAQRVGDLPDTELVAMSDIYTSKPAEVTEQPDFKNAVMLIETELEPLELLHALQEIEIEFGRQREGSAYQPYGPRTLDLDIIDYEGAVQNDPQLTLPHPKALYRDFVVSPLLEISPNHVLADQKVVSRAAVDCGEIIASEPGQEESHQLASRIDSVQRTFKDDGLGPSTSLRTTEMFSAHGDLAHGDGSHELASGKLSICATPIGNLGDITLRVLETLKAADFIYCEDTRVTRKLTASYQIDTPLKRADAHKLPELLPTIVAQLEEGRQLAYVSDAGMPGISDPGGLLVAAVREAGHMVEVLPGASALSTALAASGIKAHNHYFGGYFPRKVGAGRRLLESLSGLEDTVLVFYESKHRTEKSLGLIAEVLPARHVIMARELTKLHEELLSGAATEVAALISERIAHGKALKGEVVILIAPKSAC